jgi:hypothetical protein
MDRAVELADFSRCDPMTRLPAGASGEAGSHLNRSEGVVSARNFVELAEEFAESCADNSMKLQHIVSDKRRRTRHGG